jgi:hypothetical protein
MNPADDETLMSFRLSRGDLTRLDDTATRLGYSRSELVRLLLRRGLSAADELAPKDSSAGIRGDRPRSPPQPACGAA